MEEEKRGAEADSKLFLKNKFLQKIDYLLVKRMIHNEEVYYLFKDFLREYANVSYEFTHQEIISELKNIYIPGKIRGDFFDLINNVFIYEYSPKSFSVDELHSFLNDLKSFLDQLIIIHKDKKSFFSNLKEKFKIKKKGHSDEQEKQVKTEEQVVSKKEISSVVGYSNNLPSTEPSDDSYVKFQTFLEQLYFSFDNNDFETAKKYYNDLLSMYKSLDVDNQKKYYEELMDGYRKLSSNF